MFDWIWPVVCLACRRNSRQPWCADCAPGTLLVPPSPSFAVERTFAVDRYERPIGQALKRAKANADRPLAARLARVFAAHVTPLAAEVRPAAIVPAPSALKTRWKRGFSMASVLAVALSRSLGVPVVHALKSTATTRLATLTAEGRRAALRGRIRAIREIRGTVLLVDDVLTTGATADACAVELLGGRTESVVLTTLAAVSRRHPMKSVQIW